MSQEATTRNRVVDLGAEDNGEDVVRLITYSYTSGFVDDGDVATTENQPSLLAAHLDRLDASSSSPQESDAAAAGKSRGGQASCISPPEAIQARLLANVRVYALAEKYRVSGLKELAAQQFGTIVEGKPPCTNFAIVAREVCQTTGESDSSLRSSVANYCAAKYESLVDNADFGHVLREHGELGVDILKQLSEIQAIKGTKGQKSFGGSKSERHSSSPVVGWRWWKYWW